MYRCYIDTVSIQCRYCVDTASIQYRYSIGKVSIQYRFSIDTVSIQYRYYIDTVSILYRYFIDTVSILHRYCWNCIGSVSCADKLEREFSICWSICTNTCDISLKKNYGWITIYLKIMFRLARTRAFDMLINLHWKLYYFVSKHVVWWLDYDPYKSRKMADH